MCIKISSPSMPEPQKAPPPITPRVEKDTSVLPSEKELTKPGDQKGVEFGSKKDAGAAAGKKVGAAALRIPLNVPGGGAGETGGVNSGGT